MIVHELFSNNNLIGSWVIRILTKAQSKGMSIKKIPSHTAILKGQFVYESTFFSGVRVVPFEAWKRINNLVNMRSVRIDMTDAQVETVYVNIWGKRYDFKGVLYFAYYLGRFALFGSAIPTENKWNDPDKFFCSEANGKVMGHDHQMKSPVALMIEACKH